jgi:hypothetical protein
VGDAGLINSPSGGIAKIGPLAISSIRSSIASAVVVSVIVRPTVGARAIVPISSLDLTSIVVPGLRGMTISSSSSSLSVSRGIGSIILRSNGISWTVISVVSRGDNGRLSIGIIFSRLIRGVGERGGNAAAAAISVTIAVLIARSEGAPGVITGGGGIRMAGVLGNLITEDEGDTDSLIRLVILGGIITSVAAGGGRRCMFTGVVTGLVVPMFGIRSEILR